MIDPDPAGRQPGVWLSRAAAGLFALSLGLVLALAVIWTTRGFAVFNYTEGILLGSMAGFKHSGVPGLYPPDWTSPPLVLTLYPPVFFWATAALGSVLGASDPLVAPRLVSLAATVGLGWSLVRIRHRGGTDWTWFLILVGAASLHPGVQRQLAAAQVDVLAVAWTVAGALLVLRSEEGRGRIWPAFACFTVAVFTKQSFVAAPAALLLYRYVSGRRREAVREAVVLAGTVIGGFLLLDRWSAGGFSAHTLAAVTDSGSVVNFFRVIGDSAPYLWVPLTALVLLGVRGRLRPGFPEFWAGFAALVHAGAMFKTGSSVNYFLEPAVAVVVLGLARSGDASWVPGPRAGTRRLFLAVFAMLVVGSVIRAGEVVRDISRASRAVRIQMAAFENGYPLVEVDFFPAILEHGGRPYVSDPFAFGALAESGAWDPAPLAADLAARRVPFALTTMDITHPLADGAKMEDMLFAYFWRMAAVRDGLRAEYTMVTNGQLFVWVPREDED